LKSKLKSAAHDYLTHQLTVKKAAKNHNLNYYTFKNYLEDSNIKIKKYINRQYFFNERIFKDINTEEKAYWLGFLYADGSIIGNERACEVSQSSANVDILKNSEILSALLIHSKLNILVITKLMFIKFIVKDL